MFANPLVKFSKPSRFVRQLLIKNQAELGRPPNRTIWTTIQPGFCSQAINGWNFAPWNPETTEPDS